MMVRERSASAAIILSQHVCVSVCLSETLMLNILETKRFRGLCLMGSLYESARGASIGEGIDDVT